MKRTAKILAILLTLVLAFGIAAIVSSAEAVTGVNETKTGNFDGFDASYKTDATSGNPSGTGYDWQLKDRVGTVSIGVSEDGSGNKYMIYTQSPAKGSSGPYLGSGYGGKGTAGLANKTQRPTVDANTGVLSHEATDISAWPYLVFDFDVMAPTGKWASNVGLELRSFMNDGNTTLDSIYYGAATKQTVRFEYDEGGAYISDSTGENKLYVSPTEFTHVTLVWKAVVTETTRSVDVYVYVNGEFFFCHEGGAPKNNKDEAFENGYYNDTPHMSYDEIRINWPTANKPDHITAYDNIITRLFDTKYTGNLGDVIARKDNLDGLDVALYDEEKVPFGIAVAQLGDAKYDNLAEAIAAAEENDTITLLRDVTETVAVDKILTIDAGEFTANLKAADGYAVDDTTEGVYKVINSAGQTIEVIWDDCFDGACDEDFDINHPFYHYEEEVSIYTKFFDVYNPVYTGYIGNDGVIYTLAGWKNVATDEVLTADSAVTAELCGEGFIELAPIYEKAVIDFYWIEGGVQKFAGAGEKTLDYVMGKADTGTTVTLGNDITFTGSVTVTRKLTLDLNGHTIVDLTNGKNVRKALFNVGTGTDITITSSVVGGKIYNNGFNNSSVPGSFGIFNVQNNDAKITIIGKDAQGNHSLSIYSTVLIYAYSSTAEYYIDGGIYVGAGSDNMGYIDIRRAGADGTIKNAVIYAVHSSGLLCYSGRDQKTDDDATVIIDNCVLIAPNKVVNSVVDPVVVKITNSYIYGDVKPALNSSYSNNTVGTVILGEGVYLSGATNANVILEEGYKLYNDPTAKEVTYETLTWKYENCVYDVAGSIPVVHTETLTFDKKTSNAKDVEIIWKNADGEIIGKSVALSGSTAVPPVDMKTAGTIIPGWLDYIPAEWNESLVVPAGVDTYEITAKEGGSVTPFATAKLYINFAMETHLQARLFVPKTAEGITITALTFGGTDRLSTYKSSATYVINGEKYAMVSIWPGMIAALNDRTAHLTFTYGGEEYTVKSEGNNFKGYAEYVLANEYSEDAKALVANVANYIYTGAVVRGNTGAASKLEAIVNNNSARLYKITAETKRNDVSAAADYIASVAVSVADYNPTITFSFTEAAVGGKVNGTDIASTDTKISAAKQRFSVHNNYKITVTPAEGEEVVVYYSMVNYYDALVAASANANTLAFVEAMYGVAMADAAY